MLKSPHLRPCLFLGTLIIWCLHIASTHAQSHAEKPLLQKLRAELESPNEEIQLRAKLKLATALRWSDPEQSLAFADEAIVQAKQLQFGRALTSSYNKKALTYWAAGSYKKALLNMQKSTEQALEFTPCFIPVLQRNMAMCYIETKQADSALILARASIKAPNECTADQLQDGVVEFYAGQAFLLMREYDSAQFYFEAAKNLAANNGFENIIPAVSREMGILETERGNYTKALDYLYASKKEFIEVGDSLQLEKTFRAIGTVHLLLKNKGLGFVYFRKALQIAQNLNLSHLSFLSYNEMGSQFQQLNAQDSALHYFEYCLQLSNNALFDYEAYDLLLGVARCHEALGNELEAHKKGTEALSQATSSRNTIGEFECKLFLASLTITQEPKGAYSLANEVFIESINKGWPLLQMNAAWVLYETCKTTDSFHLALRYFKINRRLHDSLSNANIRLKGRQMNVSQAIAQKEKELLALKIELSEAERKSKKDWGLKLLSGVLMLAIIVGSLLFLWFQKRKRLHAQENNSLVHNMSKQTEKTLSQELSFKRRELIQFSLQIAQKNDFLETLKADIDHLAKQPMVEGKALQKLSRHLEINIQSKTDWEDFKYHFNQVESGLLEQLNSHYPQLTRNDIRLCALLSMALPNDEIARILNIQPESLRKAIYRLRQKMDLPKSESIEERLKALTGKSPLPTL